MRNRDEPWICIIFGEEEAERTISNMESKTVFNGRLTKAEGRRVLFRLHCLTIELHNGMVIDTRSTVFHVMSDAPQLTIEFA